MLQLSFHSPLQLALCPSRLLLHIHRAIVEKKKGGKHYELTIPLKTESKKTLQEWFN